MNNLVKICIIVGLFTSSYTCNGAKRVFGSPEASKEYNNKVNIERCIAQIQDFCPTIIDLLTELFSNIDYWKIQKLTPFSYFLSKDPVKWIFRKQEWQKIDMYIEFLEKEEKHNAYYLGQFRKILYEHTINPDYSEQKLLDIIYILEQCLEHYPCYVAMDKNLSLHEVYKRLDNTALLINKYKFNASYVIANYSKPNHFKRNWLYYFVGTSVAVGLSYFVYQKKNSLKDWAIIARDALKNFWDEHVSSPIANSLEILLRSDRQPLKTKEGVEAKRIELDAATETCVRRLHPLLTDEEVQKIIQQVEVDNTAFITQDCDEKIQKISHPDENVEDLNVNSYAHSFINWIEKRIKKGKGQEGEASSIDQFLLFLRKAPEGRDLVELFNIRLLAKEYALDKGMLEFENQIKANRLNFELAAVLPSALLIYSSYNFVKKIVVKIVWQKTTYQPLKKILRNLHRLYNNHGVYQEELSITDQGFSYYWIDQCRKYAANIDLDNLKMIMEDLEELESLDLKVHQKLNIIQRMYFNYPFLLPTDTR